MKDSRSSKQLVSDVKAKMEEFSGFISGGKLDKLKGNVGALHAIDDFRLYLHTIKEA